jgi:hypothetical protein
LIVPCAWLFQSLFEWIVKSSKKGYIGTVAVCCIALFIGFNGLLGLLGNVARRYDASDTEPDTVAEYVLNHTNKDDLVQMIGGNVTLNYRAQRLAASRHVHYGSGPYSQEMRRRFAQEIADDVMRARPKLIMFYTESVFSEFMDNLSNSELFDDFLLESYDWKDVDFNYDVWLQK